MLALNKIKYLYSFPLFQKESSFNFEDELASFKHIFNYIG